MAYKDINQNLDTTSLLNQVKASGQDGRVVSGLKSSLGDTGDANRASPSAIARYIEGIHFPCEKQALLDRVRQNNAPEKVVHLVEQFENKQYDSVIAISKEVSRLEPGSRHNEEGKHGPSPAAVEHYLKGMHYPASKQDLVNKAKENGASADIVQTLNKFDDRHTFSSPIDVSKAFGAAVKS